MAFSLMPRDYLYPCSKLFDNKKYALNAFDVGFKKAYSHLKDDLNCKMCRGTINSAMTKAINITPQTALYTSWQAIKFKIRQIFLKKKFMMYKNNPFRFYISKKTRS